MSADRSSAPGGRRSPPRREGLPERSFLSIYTVLRRHKYYKKSSSPSLFVPAAAPAVRRSAARDGCGADGADTAPRGMVAGQAGRWALGRAGAPRRGAVTGRAVRLPDLRYGDRTRGTATGHAERSPRRAVRSRTTPHDSRRGSAGSRRAPRRPARGAGTPRRGTVTGRVGRERCPRRQRWAAWDGHRSAVRLLRRAVRQRDGGADRRPGGTAPAVDVRPCVAWGACRVTPAAW